MVILNQDKTAIIKWENVHKMYIGGDKCSIKVDFTTGDGAHLGWYGDEINDILSDFFTKLADGATGYIFPPANSRRRR